jgi:putative NADPH-quinone reductase
MRVLVIYCRKASLPRSHTVVLEALRHSSHEATDVDLYAEAFDRC